jgi:hypothetical protein
VFILNLSALPLLLSIECCAHLWEPWRGREQPIIPGSIVAFARFPRSTWGIQARWRSYNDSLASVNNKYRFNKKITSYTKTNKKYISVVEKKNGTTPNLDCIAITRHNWFGSTNKLFHPSFATSFCGLTSYPTTNTIIILKVNIENNNTHHKRSANGLRSRAVFTLLACQMEFRSTLLETEFPATKPAGW